MDSALLSLIL